MHDSWIPGFQPGTFSTLEHLPDDAPIRFLMTASGDAWDMERINLFFTEEIVTTIQLIPISRSGVVTLLHGRMSVLGPILSVPLTNWPGPRLSMPRNVRLARGEVP